MFTILRDQKFWRDVGWGILAIPLIPVFIVVVLPLLMLGMIGSAAKDMLR